MSSNSLPVTSTSQHRSRRSKRPSHPSLEALAVIVARPGKIYLCGDKSDPDTQFFADAGYATETVSTADLVNGHFPVLTSGKERHLCPTRAVVAINILDNLSGPEVDSFFIWAKSTLGINGVLIFNMLSGFDFAALLGEANARGFGDWGREPTSNASWLNGQAYIAPRSESPVSTLRRYSTLTA